MHDILQARQQLGEYHRLVQELRLDDGRFQRYFRLDREQFNNLLSKLRGRTPTIGVLLMRLNASQFVFLFELEFKFNLVILLGWKLVSLVVT